MFLLLYFAFHCQKKSTIFSHIHCLFLILYLKHLVHIISLFFYQCVNFFSLFICESALYTTFVVCVNAFHVPLNYILLFLIQWGFTSSYRSIYLFSPSCFLSLYTYLQSPPFVQELLRDTKYMLEPFPVKCSLPMFPNHSIGNINPHP